MHRRNTFLPSRTFSTCKIGGKYDTLYIIQYEFYNKHNTIFNKHCTIYILNMNIISLYDCKYIYLWKVSALKTWYFIYKSMHRVDTITWTKCVKILGGFKNLSLSLSLPILFQILHHSPFFFSLYLLRVWLNWIFISYHDNLNLTPPPHHGILWGRNSLSISLFEI